MKVSRGIGEWIALIVTITLVIVMIGDFAVLASIAIREPSSPGIIDALKDILRDLVLLFAAGWRTNFGGNTTVNTEQANVSAGTGSPSPANVERMTVTNAETEK